MLGLRILFDLEGFHQRGGVLIDMARVAVIIAHEGLGAAQDVALRIGEGGGHHALELEGELVGALVGVVVEFVADAVEEIVGFLDFAARGGGEQLAFDEVLESGAAAFDPGDPLDAVIVAHAAAAFLDVGFLQENGVGIFLMAAAQVLAAEFEKGRLSLVDAFLGEAGLEIAEQRGIAGDQPGVHQRGFVFLVGLGLLDAFGDRAAGVADLEAHVPEQVKHVLDEFLQRLGQIFGGPWQQEEQVDVRARVEQGAAVAAGGDQRDGEGAPSLRAWIDASRIEARMVSMSAARLRAISRPPAPARWCRRMRCSSILRNRL